MLSARIIQLNNMKQLTKLLLGFSLVALTFIGCRRYDDTFIKGEITRLDKRITSLEERVNTNIISVTTMVEALQDNDYVVSTEEYFENGVQVGYKIVFKKQKPIIIFFGKDGTNGSNGTDGHTPQIGVRQDNDGLWYWTVDGQWLLNADKEKVRASARDGRDGTDGHTYSISAVRAEDNLLYWQIDGSWLLDEKGNKVRAEGVDGSSGADGHSPSIDVRQDEDGLWYWTIDGQWLLNSEQKKVRAVGIDGKDGLNGGADGKDGITPQLKIEDGYWMVSTDKGLTWTNIGSATGAAGKDGDSFFSSVDTSNEDRVVITMAVGTEFSFPTWASFETLQNTVNEVNNYVNSVKTIIEAADAGDYVTSTAPYMENGVQVGYQINFAKGDPLVIYNGKDGAAGKDGYTPRVGVKKNDDNLWYWTIDGEWLTDEQGNKVKAVGTDGKDGVDGTDGTNGDNGTDGVTPQLKIEDNYWFVSTDKGQTWSQLGKATGEDGEDGAPGKDGDSFFSSVDTSNEDCVVITMADGTEFSFPTWTVFQTLQNTVNQINQNISSYQTIIEALQESDYVVSTSPYLENGKQVGYQINFAQSGPLVIYNGKDGKDGSDGSNGTNGNTPQLGVCQDQSGTYYWTVDGEWLTDEQGNKVKAVGKDGKDGVNGTDGTNGTNGNNGTDGVTPQLKIESGYWFVSTDNGQTWTQLGKATGEDGQDGAPGKDGDSFFQSLTQDDNNVYLTLSNQTILTLPKSSTLDISFTNADNLALQTGVSKTIGYTVTSSVKPVTVEVVTSADIRAKVISGDNTGTSGSITIVAKDEIDEYSQIIVFVSNGQNVITRTFTPTDGGTLIRTSDARVRVPAEGGVVDISFLSSLEYEVIIPQEAQSWITLLPKTRAIEYTESLFINENNNEERDCEIIIKTTDGKLSISYIITQSSQSVFGITLDSNAIKLFQGQTFILTPSIYPSYATNKAIVWNSSDLNVATVSDAGSVTAKADGTATITATTVDGGYSATCSVTVIPTAGTYNGHTWVDLGLPSGTKWSDRNLGASATSDFGNYYSWGEISFKETYKTSAYKWYNGNVNVITKYNTDSAFGTVDNKTVLEPADDAAIANWGGSWKVPSKEQWEELINNCDWTWSAQNGNNGYIITSRTNGSSIFLAASGYYSESGGTNINSGGSYWACSLNDPHIASNLSFSVSSILVHQGYRHLGQTIRPVTTNIDAIPVSSISLDITSLSLNVGYSKTLIATVIPSTAANKAVTWTSSNTNVATVTTGVVTAKATGTAIITVTTVDGKHSATCTVTVTAATSGTNNGHAWVDLGLPSGTKWAMKNVGASAESSAGTYYAWAETTAKNSTNYKWLSYNLYDDETYYSKYTISKQSVGTGSFAADNKTTVETADDAARSVMGGSWRMPTKAEMQELINNCTWTWTSVNGIPGYNVQSKKNSNSIFLPAGGYKQSTSVSGNKTAGHYWTSSLGSVNEKAWCCTFSSSSKSVVEQTRNCGRLIRGVCK